MQPKEDWATPSKQSKLNKYSVLHTALYCSSTKWKALGLRTYCTVLTA